MGMQNGGMQYQSGGYGGGYGGYGGYGGSPMSSFPSMGYDPNASFMPQQTQQSSGFGPFPPGQSSSGQPYAYNDKPQYQNYGGMNMMWGMPPPWMMAGGMGGMFGYGQQPAQAAPQAAPQTDYLAQFMQNAPWTKGMTPDQVKQALYTITPTDYGNYSQSQEDAINHVLGFTPSASTYVPGVGYLQSGYTPPSSTPPGNNPISRPSSPPPTSTPPPGGNPIGRPGGSTAGLTPDQVGYGMRVQNGQLVFGGSSPTQMSPTTANYLGYKNNGQGQWVNSQGQVVGLV